jgi:molybdate transport system ATP-binding protein
MTAPFLLDVQVALAPFTLAVRWATAETSLGVFGPSGAGKTTLLEAVAGLRRDTRGRIVVQGEVWLDSARGIDLAPERRGVGYVPQDVLLFPHRDVQGNLQAGRRRAERPGARRLDPGRVLEVLELESLRSREVASLSGGERQRVALGRALCSAPLLLLLDEPLAGVDLALRRRILPYLWRVREEFEIPTLYVSHDATEIQMLAREVLVLEAGRVAAQGAPASVLASAGVLPLSRADGFENVLRGRVVEARPAVAVAALANGARLSFAAAGLAVGQEVSIGVRAEDLILSLREPAGLSARNALAAVIREVRPGGVEESEAPAVVATLEPGGGPPLVVLLTDEAIRELGLEVGLPVYLLCKAQACRLLAAR